MPRINVRMGKQIITNFTVFSYWKENISKTKIISFLYIFIIFVNRTSYIFNVYNTIINLRLKLIQLDWSSICDYVTDCTSCLLRWGEKKGFPKHIVARAHYLVSYVVICFPGNITRARTRNVIRVALRIFRRNCGGLLVPGSSEFRAAQVCKYIYIAERHDSRAWLNDHV